MSKQLCPECGKPLPTGSPDGMCPSCLFNLGVIPPHGSPGDAPPSRDAEPASATVASSSKSAGARIGHYKLLEVIGEGGFGIVWMAEQLEPVRRRVALKVLKLGMDTREVVARFEAERQALAMMDHANIAKVLDAGATESGRPFFVMELVGGVPITTFCDTRRLNTRERIELFVLVCEAVQHAHQKGVIHRDLKPGNILVSEQDGRFVPKVIDFGVAKALEEPLTDKTLFTRYQQFIGTPAYMSPEQAGLGGLDVDTRSDIYSLGVLLYELLTGKPPFSVRELAQQGRESMLKMIRESEPLRPSTRLTLLSEGELTALADCRRESTQQFSKLLRGELDWIMLKALDKDRARRYATANGFAAELRRYLKGEAVTAAPPTMAYRFSKFARKNRIAIATVTAFAVLLIAGIVATSWQAVRATHLAGVEAEQRARAEASEASARRSLYAAEMNIAQQAYLENNLGRAAELLEKHAPKDPLSQPASAFWEWRYLWDNARSDELFQLVPHSHAVTSVAFAPDGQTVISGCIDKLVRVWEFPSRRLAATFTNLYGIRAVAVADGDGAVWLLDSERATGAIPVAGPGPKVRLLSFSADGRCLGWLRNYHTVEIWNIQGHRVFELKNPPEKIYLETRAYALSRNGRSLVIGFNSGELEVYDLSLGRRTAQFREHRFLITDVAISPDERTVVSAGAEGTIKVYDLRENKIRATLTGQLNTFGSLAISPAGDRLAAGGADGSVMIWDLSSTNPLEVSRLRDVKSSIEVLVFADDGDALVGLSRARPHRIEDLLVWRAASWKAIVDGHPAF